MDDAVADAADGLERLRGCALWAVHPTVRPSPAWEVTLLRVRQLSFDRLRKYELSWADQQSAWLLSSDPGFADDLNLFRTVEVSRWPALKQWAESEAYSRPAEPKLDGFGDVVEEKLPVRRRDGKPGGGAPRRLAPLNPAAAVAGGGAAAGALEAEQAVGVSVEWLLDWAIENELGGDCQWFLDSPAGRALQVGLAAGLKGGCSPNCAARSVASTLRTAGEEPPFDTYLGRVIKQATLLRKIDPTVDDPLPQPLTTGQVREQLVIPATAACRRPYAEAFGRQGGEVAAIGLCASPTHVVVHSHRLRFWDLLHCLVGHQLGGAAAALAGRRRSARELRDMLRRHYLSGKTRFFYFVDVFCWAQHPAGPSRFEQVGPDLTGPTAALMQRVGRCVVATDAPGGDGAPGARLWCLTELLLAKAAGA